jgi:hypothetical protein
MDMNPVVSGPDAAFVYKDGIAFSGHKFIGGPGIISDTFRRFLSSVSEWMTKSILNKIT